MKHRVERGEGSSTARLSDDQVNKVLAALTTTTSEKQEKVTQHTAGYLHMVTQLLHTLTNVVLETRIPQEGSLQRAIEVDIRTRV